MNKNELNEALEFLNNPKGTLQIILYAQLKGSNKVKMLDIKSTDLPKIQSLFIESVNSKIIQKDSHLLALSTADERGNCFYEYDLDLPEELECINELVGNDDVETFSFKNDELTQIESLIIVIADNEKNAVLYNKISPVEVVGRGGYMLWKSNQRLERFEDNLLRVSPKFQIIKVDEKVIIIDLNLIERSFGFHEVIQREASKGVTAIEKLDIVDDIDVLKELVSDISFARKLTKIAKDSPVIKLQIPNDKIIEFSKRHPATRNMKYTEDNSQFKLGTKVSKDLFIKILNDDLLTSELTQLHYDSLAKDGIKTEDSGDKEDQND